MASRDIGKGLAFGTLDISVPRVLLSNTINYFFLWHDLDF
jgi:hypothetical protein